MEKLKILRRGFAALALILGAALATTADAADFPVKARTAPVLADPTMSWTGAYVGLNGGGVFGKTRQDEITNPSTTGNFNVSGAMAGLTAGYNFQFSQFVIGAEADIDWTDLHGGSPCPNNGAPNGFQCFTQSSYLGTLRARAGFAIDKLFLFGTAGVAFGNIRQRFTPPFPPGPIGFSGASSDRVGAVFGGGAEYAFNRNWSIKAEYLYTRLGTFTCTIECTGVPGEIAKIKLDENVARIGVNYHF